jgi:hypothetical protein
MEGGFMGFIVKKTAIRVDGRKLVVVKGRSNLEKEFTRA